MKKVRKSIFETNSSSSHSIHIDNEMTLMDTSLIPNEDGEIDIRGGEYGWEWEKLENAYDKASYCLVDNGDRNMLERVIMKQTGAKKVNFIIDGDDYIDHESYGNSSKAFKNDETLRNLLFNPRSTIYLGNDNGNPPLNFYCDSKIGRYKISVISTDVLREMNINSILDDNVNIKDEDLNWTYSVDNSSEKLYAAIEEFLSNYNMQGFSYNYNEDYWLNDEIDVDKRIVKLTKTTKGNGLNREILDEKTFNILIKENI